MAHDKNISKAADDSAAFFTAIDRADAPLFDHIIRPHRSMTPYGFAWLIGLVAFGFSLPMAALIGKIAIWGMFPFILITLLGLYYFVMRNYADGTVREHVRIWPDLMAVHRHNPRAPDQYWICNPYWVRIKMADTKVLDNYITLTGGPRDIELGAFLSPEERKDLFNLIDDGLRLALTQSGPQD
jgi:uncharacterized membrane protein